MMEIAIGVLLGIVILLVIVILTMRPRAPQPDLIDLEDYAASALASVDRGEPPWPPDTVPGIMPSASSRGQWTLEEKDMMEKNRRVARGIYEYAKKKRER